MAFWDKLLDKKLKTDRYGCIGKLQPGFVIPPNGTIDERRICTCHCGNFVARTYAELEDENFQMCNACKDQKPLQGVESNK